MGRNWAQQFEIVYNKYCFSQWAEAFGKSKKGMARLFGVSHGKTQAWEKGQWPSAEDLTSIADKLGFDYKWLVTGEGDPSGSSGQPQLPNPPPQPVPVLGLAACGVEGWCQTTKIAVSATPPVISEGMVAVIATGESMMPAGIAPGHICYCDPSQQVLAGDAVYVTRKDGLATIKVYIGESERGPEWIRFKGWLTPVGDNRQKDFFLDLLRKDLDTIAPVIYVRRRI